MFPAALCVLAAFFLGSIPFGYLVIRLSSGKDIRTLGSGNMGATNVMRIAGKKLGILTLFLDAAKGALAVWLTRLYSPQESALVLAALASVAGHMFTPFLRFKGGKGVATALGSLLVLTPAAIGLSAAVFFLAVGLTRFVSLGSILAAVSYPLWVLYLKGSHEVLIAALVLAALILWRHSSNLGRLLRGTENRIQWKKGSSS